VGATNKTGAGGASITSWRHQLLKQLSRAHSVLKKKKWRESAVTTPRNLKKSGAATARIS